MTNFSVVLIVWVNMITNPAPAGYTTNGAAFYQISKTYTVNQYLADGAYLQCSTMQHSDFVTNNPPPTSPLLRGRIRGGAQTTPPIPSRRPGRPGRPRTPTTLVAFSPQVANGGTDNVENVCPMFKVWFTTNTNWIYALEKTSNFVAWSPCPPEINGTGSSESFFDALEGAGSYRIASRPGILPE